MKTAWSVARFALMLDVGAIRIIPVAMWGIQNGPHSFEIVAK